jgi:hypothetical protein
MRRGLHQTTGKRLDVQVKTLTLRLDSFRWACHLFRSFRSSRSSPETYAGPLSLSWSPTSSLLRSALANPKRSRARSLMPFSDGAAWDAITLMRSAVAGAFRTGLRPGRGEFLPLLLEQLSTQWETQGLGLRVPNALPRVFAEPSRLDSVRMTVRGSRSRPFSRHRRRRRRYRKSPSGAHRLPMTPGGSRRGLCANAAKCCHHADNPKPT